MHCIGLMFPFRSQQQLICLGWNGALRLRTGRGPPSGDSVSLQSGFRSRLRFFGLDFDDGGLCKWTLNSLHH